MAWGAEMEFDANISHLQQAYWHILMVAGPVLVVALVVGLVIGIVQAATSINEQTLSFVPKLAISMLTMALASGFMLTVMTDYFQTIFETIRAIR
jgi:flagellar biosynthetic protein FliQ